jgi:EAL domain-containing protein (putative c-di-GMP-specific phosphodiesterase class I)
MDETQIRRLTPDEVIFLENEVGDCAYLIERGRVLIYLTKDGVEVPLKVIGKGEVFGEMSLIDGSPRSASCRAIGDVQLLIVTKEQLSDRILAADPVVRLLMQALLERLRAQNDRLRGKLSSVAVDNLDSLAAEKKEALERIGLENRISKGLDNDEFIPYYQPIYDLASCEVRGCEALIRWVTKDRGVIPPNVFMDVMEDSSLILRAGQVVIEKSAADLESMRNHFGGSRDFFVSINVSGRQFMDKGFIEHLERTCNRFHVDPAQMKLELTERIMTEGSQALSTLEACRARGYQLAIDDFGTGFSSLQYLAQMPITHLKIDRAFVMNLFADQKSLMIVKSLIYMADVLGLTLIAEGIETREQLALLKSLGVRYGQGFLFSKPLPLDEFKRLTYRCAV